MVMLNGDSAALQHFDVDETDFLDHWNRQRSEYVAMANVSAAKSLVGSSSSYASLGWGMGGPCMGAWGFNAYYGMMTYIPCSGYLMNPYGYRYWSPFTVMQAYYMPNYAYNGGAMTAGTAAAGVLADTTRRRATSSGYSGVMSSGSSSMGSSVGAGSMGSTSAAASSGASAGHGGGGGAAAGGGGGHGR